MEKYNEMLKKLGSKYAFEGYFVIDTTVGGFNHLRSVAQVSFKRDNRVTVRPYLPEKRWYGDEVWFESIDSAVKFIKGKS